MTIASQPKLPLTTILVDGQFLLVLNLIQGRKGKAVTKFASR
jgi:hypothetical protein